MRQSDSAETAAGRNVMAPYVPHPGAFDEICQPDGAIRTHWRAFIDELSPLDQAEYMRRLVSARRMIRDNGVTYNVYDDEGGELRPWDLDILPLVVSANDWATIEAGVIQRAQIANAFLADVYGPQELISKGVVPPHLVHGHPQFLRPLKGVIPPGGVYVHFMSVDLGRDPSGAWRVLGERLDAPTGAGYALENRIVVSQTFPELFRDLGVHRLAAFFHDLRESVMGLAQSGRTRNVLLTPGPYNEAYFEHAYLARYLGLTLVEGDDLVVRDGALFLKTLSGLERVDVLFRRVDSDFCDPLELRSDSALGVPGLVEAARSGKTVIANALGGSVGESPALSAYYGQLSTAILGTPLLLESKRTIWCGTAEGRRAALADIDGLIFRGAFDTAPLFARGSSARVGAQMSVADRQALRSRLAARGATMIAEEEVPLSFAPIFERGHLAPRPVALRVFVAWTPKGYVVMPGSLTRVANNDGIRSLAMQAGAASKDTWVLAEGPVNQFSLLTPASETIRIRRVGDEAPSRAMDNLFWLGRYAERAENLVRVVRAVVLRLGDDAEFDAVTNAADLARRLLVPLALASHEATDAAATGDMARLAGELDALVFDRNHVAGLQRMLQNVRRTAWSVRDRLSIDTWRTTIAFTSVDQNAELSEGPDPAGMRGYLDALVRRAAALAGLAAENMTRGRNWLFLELGRRIERAINMQWLVRRTLGSVEGADQERLPLLLEIADSSMTYRYRYLGELQVVPILDLLLLDETNPRAVAFQVTTLKERVAELPRANAAQARGLDKEIVDAMLARLRAAEPDRLARVTDDGHRKRLHALLDYLDQATNQLSDAIGQTYFQHSVRRRAGFAPRREMR